MSNVSMVDGHIDRPITNYERIKNMSVEEMAEELAQVFFGARGFIMKKPIKDYLESEVETE